MIALLNLSAIGFLFVFHVKAKTTQQGNLLEETGPAGQTRQTGLTFKLDFP